MRLKMKYTKSQIEKLDSIAQKRLDKSLLVGGQPKLNDYKCRKYLNIDNATMHKPFTCVRLVAKDSIYIDVIFTGSGIMPHPKRTVWIPKDAFSSMDYFPHFLAMFYIIVNKLTFWGAK